MKNIAVFAILRDRQHVDAGAQALIDAGFREEDISVLTAERASNQDLAHEKHTKAAEGAVVGALIGLLLVGALGALVGLGRVAIAELTPYIDTTAGLVMCILAGVGVGSVIGAFIGMLFGLSIPVYEAKRYSGLIKNGRSLLSVHCSGTDGVAMAKNVLKSVGGQNIASVKESGAGFAWSHRPQIHFRSAHGPAK